MYSHLKVDNKFFFYNLGNSCEGLKSRFRFIHIFCEGNVCADKLTNLIFIYRESFHFIGIICFLLVCF